MSEKNNVLQNHLKKNFKKPLVTAIDKIIEEYDKEYNDTYNSFELNIGYLNANNYTIIPIDTDVFVEKILEKIDLDL